MVTVQGYFWPELVLFETDSRYLHNSYSYIVGHVWNNLPLPAKSASTLAEFKLHLKHCEFIGCQCQSCI